MNKIKFVPPVHLQNWKELLQIQPNIRASRIIQCSNRDSIYPHRSQSCQAARNFIYPTALIRNKDQHSPAAFQRANFSMASAGRVKEEKILLEKYKPRDITFKTPFGHIAALEWGSQKAPKKLLCIHGWLDNAGSFERLIPFILDHNDNAEKYHIVAIDHPGAGLSSHKPSGSEYTSFSTIIEMRRVIRELAWDRFSLMGHSLGGHYSFLFSCIYSHQVESLISIDCEHPISSGTQNWDVFLANSIEEIFKHEYTFSDDPTTNIRVPVYSHEDAIKRLMDAHSNSLTKDSAEVMLKRGGTKQRWGYTFNRDLRLKTIFVEFRPDNNVWMQYIEKFFQANLLNIRASQSPYKRSEALRNSYYELFKKKCRLFRDVLLDGTHHLHMNNPEIVAPEVCKFLDEIKSEESDRSSFISRSKL